MNLKKIIILTLFLSLLMIGSASAAEVSNDSQTGIDQIDENSADILKTTDKSLNEINSIKEVEENNTEIIASNIDEILEASEITVNDYNQLYNQIENLKEKGTTKSYTINLNPKGNFAITDTIKLQDGKSPTKEFIINGNGVTIDGKNSKCFLSLFENYSLTANNLNFVNNSISRDGGGAIVVHTGGELNINNCNFTGCKALNETESIHAGALRIGFDAIIRISNSIFNKNSASYGAGAIVIGGTLTEYSSSLHPDLDPKTITPTAFINNCQFIDNSAGHGGAVNIEGFCGAIITNCIFKSNSAVGPELGIGGGVCTDKSSYALLINNTFQDNTAKMAGGAIFTDETSYLECINNSFQNNIAEASGGAICTGKNSNVTITHSLFNKNQGILGGAISLGAKSDINVDTSTFTQNSAGSGGGIYCAMTNNIQIKDVELTSNTATENGGAIYTRENAVITLVNTTLTKNKANQGGGIVIGSDSEMIVDDTIFTQNIADNGGAIYITKNDNIQIKNTKITDNTATTNGGGIVTGEDNSLTVTKTTFTKNQGKVGGAVCLGANTIMNADATPFTQNSADKGGAIYGTDNNNIIIKNIELTDNTATENGGSILAGDNAVITAANTTFTKNKANQGGAILTGTNSDIILDDTILTQNSADKGGAIYTTKNNNIQIKNTKITDNTATTNGGAIRTGENNIITLTKTTFTKNKANLGGAICLGANTNMNADATPFTQNSADKGGAIYGTDNNNIIIKNIELTDNTATGNGGAILIAENTFISASNTTFTKNKANQGGAILTGTNSDIILDDTILTQNSADKGGAIYTTKNNNIQIKNTKITDNTATTNGGAILTGENNIITLTKTTFTKNKANLGGAICLNANSKITAHKTLFSQNNATKHGGVIYSTNDNNILMTNSEITNNVAATNGGAAYTGKSTSLTVSNTKFNKNTAGNIGGAICGESGTTLILANSEFNNNIANKGNAVYNPQQGTLILKGNTSLDSADYVNSGELETEKTVNTKISIDSIDYSSELVVEGTLVDEYGSPITDETVSVSVGNENIRANTDDKGKLIASFANINPGTYTISSTYTGNSVYNKATTSINKKIVKREPTSITASDVSAAYNVEKYLTVTLVNSQNSPIAKATITVDLGTGAKTYTTDSNGQVKISTKDLSVNTYVADIRFNGTDNYKESNATAKITINKQKTQIVAADVTTTYKTNKDFVVTLKNIQNSPMANNQIKINLGTGVKTYTTDSNGQVKISTGSLDPDTYNIKINYKGDENYEQSNTTAKITINKLKTQLTATDITITYNTKKDVIATLKNEQNAPLSDEMIIVTIRKSIKSYNTDSNGQIKIPTSTLNPDTYDAIIKYNGNENYQASNTTAKITINKDSTKITIVHKNKELIITFTNGQNTPLNTMPLSINLGKGLKAYTTDNNGQVKIPTNDFAPDTYAITAKYNGNEKYLPTNTTSAITIGQETTQITATDVTTTYNTNKDFIVTLKNSQNSPLANVEITVDFGTGAKTYQTDSNGQVTIPTGSLVPKTYTVKIAFEGNGNYMKSSSEAKVIVKKATVKLTAKSTTFKKSVKTKKYTVTLKNNKNKVMKKVKLTLKVNGKTYSATTNTKGKATFKITKLTKKGTFTAVVKFASNKYYNSKTVKPKIKVK